MAMPMASIIVNNYNYGRFLREAIDSALNQTYRNTEVIVVDDGSADNSREIIARYGDRIVPVLKENGGQASAFNRGFEVCRGELIVFLDSDDVLLTTAVERAFEVSNNGRVAKVHWPLWVIDEEGRRNDGVLPHHPLPEGDLRELVIDRGPHSYVWPPTSGNAWARSFIASVFPIPESEYRICADGYLSLLVPFFGSMKRVSDPQAFYRIHGRSSYSSLSFDEKLTYDLSCYQLECTLLDKFSRSIGIQPDPERWKRNSRYRMLQVAVQDLAPVIPTGASFILVDHATWEGTGEMVAGRRRIPFTERDGQYWGPPSDDFAAIRELERLRRSGARFIVFAWEAFWCLDHYHRFQQYLRSNFSCILENSRLVVFELTGDRFGALIPGPSAIAIASHS